MEYVFDNGQNYAVSNATGLSRTATVIEDITAAWRKSGMVADEHGYYILGDAAFKHVSWTKEQCIWLWNLSVIDYVK